MIQKLRRALYWFANIVISTNKRDFVKRGGLGKSCMIYADVEFGSEPYLIRIGNNCRITNGVRFVTHDGGLWVLKNQGLLSSKYGKFGPIIVKDNVHIGWNAIIMLAIKNEMKFGLSFRVRVRLLWMVWSRMLRLVM